MNAYTYYFHDMVQDRHEWFAACPRCRWESDAASNPQSARIRADQHNTDHHGGDGVGPRPLWPTRGGTR